MASLLTIFLLSRQLTMSCDYFHAGPTSLSIDGITSTIIVGDVMEISFELRLNTACASDYCHLFKIGDPSAQYPRLPMIDFPAVEHQGLQVIFSDIDVRNRHYDVSDSSFTNVIANGNYHTYYFKWSQTDRIFVFDGLSYHNTTVNYDSTQYYQQQYELIIIDTFTPILISGSIKNLCVKSSAYTPSPTTMTPTTPMPTTSVPTTYIPTTNIPTTNPPTTNMPTINSPTTNMPTTFFPTTLFPTTRMPTTAIPTTNIPTTLVPTTQSETLIIISETYSDAEVVSETQYTTEWNSDSLKDNDYVMDYLVYLIIGMLCLICIITSIVLCIKLKGKKRSKIQTEKNMLEMRSVSNNNRIESNADNIGQIFNGKVVTDEVMINGDDGNELKVVDGPGYGATNYIPEDISSSDEIGITAMDTAGANITNEDMDEILKIISDEDMSKELVDTDSGHVEIDNIGVTIENDEVAAPVVLNNDEFVINGDDVTTVR